MLTNDEVESFTHLGLSLNQAKVYLALVQSGISPARTISKISGIARHDIYRTTLKLLRLGLISKTLSRPAYFEAISLTAAINILVKQKKQEIAEIENVAKKIVETLNDKAKKTTRQESFDFILIAGKERILNKKIKAWNNARLTVDFITTSYKLLPFIYTYGKCHLNALNKGTKIRCIIEKPEKSEPKNVRDLKRNCSFRIKYLPTVPYVHLGLFDRKIAFINTIAEPKLTDSALLWTNNQCVLALIQDYFEILWMTAMEKPMYTIDGGQI